MATEGDNYDDENLINIKLFFYCDEKALKGRVFTEEWDVIMQSEYGAD